MAKQVPVRRKVSFFQPEPLELANSNELKIRLLDAARRCLIEHGAEKMSMSHVAEAAEASRASVYKYFANREALIDAVLALSVETLAGEAGQAMALHSSLEDQVAAMAVVVLQWGMAEREAGIWSDTEASVIVSKAAEPLLERLIELTEKKVIAARDRGELRANVDTGQAAEWLARLAYSLVAFPAHTFDENNLTEVTNFVRRHAVAGLD